MNPKRQRFVDEYLVDLNATQAAVRAGYSKHTAKMQGARLLTFDDVKAAVDARKVKRAEKVEVKAEEVLRELQTFGHFDPKGLYGPDGLWLSVPEMPENVRRAIASIEVDELFTSEGKLRGYTRKVKFWNKPQGLELLGKHVKLFGDEAAGVVTNVFQIQNNQLTVQLDFSRLTLEEHRQLAALMEKATPPAK